MASTATILAVVNLCLAMASNQSMAFRVFLVMINLAVMASTARILAMVKPSVEMASTWSMPFLISLGMIGFAVVVAREQRRKRESSCSSSGINYEVFLSFRGPDTRKGFTDHLHSKLVDVGIHVFRDDEKLRAGEGIKPQLKEAIKGSKISIAILSKDYASSPSCLMEVEHMWECSESNGHTIIPIFYDVSPYDVKRQAGDFENSFTKYVKDGEPAQTIKKWKDIFRKIGGLSGYDLKNKYGGYESILVEEVVGRVSELLKKDERVVTDNLVGLELHIQEMMRKLGVVYNDGEAIQASGEDVYAVGICGLPGVGKTTLAKVVFNKILSLFEKRSFLEGIHSKEVTSSQATLIDKLGNSFLKPGSLKYPDDGIKEIQRLSEGKKVLIVLDDVHEVAEIGALAGKLSWFGPGSRIIVTTRKRNVLNGFDDGAAEEYKLEPLRDYHALQLFRKHAFQGDAPQDVSEYDSLSIDIVKTIGGLPLAIRVTASNLHRKNIKKWKSTLKFLKKNQEDQVDAAFMASYNSLHRHGKEIFLDIACFFIGQDERIPSYMWEACGYCPDQRIERLREMLLLEDGENDELRMHDMLRDFGRKLANKKDLHKRCRLWDHNDAFSFLRDGKDTESVKAIGLTAEKYCTVSLSCETFRKVPNLRYLRLDRADIEGNTRNLLPNLRWLDWCACRSLSDLDNMHLKELVILDLSWSPITDDSQFWRQIMEKVEELKVLNLQGCVQLPALLNFPAPISLEMLILEDCTLLSEIGPFIRNLKKLRSLNLRKCRGVERLPQELCRMEFLRELLIDGSGIQRIDFQEGSLKNLEILSARDCRCLQNISTLGSLRNLSNLALDGADIDGLPDNFEFPQELHTLSLRNCRKLGKLPTSIGKLSLLEVMDLSCTKIKELPESVKNLRNLKTLKMTKTHLRKFPKDILKLKNLEEIDFSSCRALGGKVRCDISGLSSLRILRLSSSNVAGLPMSISGLSRLQTLDILSCNQLRVLPKLPTSLLSLHWGSKNMTVPNLSYLKNLKVLCLKDVEQRKGGLLNLKSPIRWITRLTSLETLELSLPNVPNLPWNFSALTQLRELSLSYMKKLHLTQLPLTSSLSILFLKHCKIQKPKFSSLKYLSELELDDCNLAKVDGLEDLRLLEVLKIVRCKSITNLNGLEKLGRLRKVQIISSPLAVLPELSTRVEVDRRD